MSSPCRILCIDDHRDSAEMLQMLLVEEGHDVVGASSISEALDLVTREAFDLYVLDRRLPDGTGIELCHRLAQVTPSVPCIFYSGDSYEVHREQAMAAGAEDYISKPNIETLIQTITKVLSDRECTTA